MKYRINAFGKLKLVFINMDDSDSYISDVSSADIRNDKNKSLCDVDTDIHVAFLIRKIHIHFVVLEYNDSYFYIWENNVFKFIIKIILNVKCSTNI